jgi:hypothetical protein
MIARALSWWSAAPLPVVITAPLPAEPVPTSAELCAEAELTTDAEAFSDWLCCECSGEQRATSSPHTPPLATLSVAQLSVASRQTWRKAADRLAAIDELQRRYLAASAALLVKLAQEYERP